MLTIPLQFMEGGVSRPIGFDPCVEAGDEVLPTLISRAAQGVDDRQFALIVDALRAIGTKKALCAQVRVMAAALQQRGAYVAQVIHQMDGYLRARICESSAPPRLLATASPIDVVGSWTAWIERSKSDLRLCGQGGSFFLPDHLGVQPFSQQEVYGEEARTSLLRGLLECETPARMSSHEHSKLFYRILLSGDALTSDIAAELEGGKRLGQTRYNNQNMFWWDVLDHIGTPGAIVAMAKYLSHQRAESASGWILTLDRTVRRHIRASDRPRDWSPSSGGDCANIWSAWLSQNSGLLSQDNPGDEVYVRQQTH